MYSRPTMVGIVDGGGRSGGGESSLELDSKEKVGGANRQGWSGIAWQHDWLMSFAIGMGACDWVDISRCLKRYMVLLFLDLFIFTIEIYRLTAYV